ncbi:DUF3239 domain-containing protein [Dysgonomonas sp. 25]|uniref:DUF3239 domain-containing protein n=1 Tax=Dysgonomonas sp. 25 TaxID=2302933 RepID=UPI0013D3A804|nr:DUF3239 domain-containing protein [Dysgonomonas sp. 25]
MENLTEKAQNEGIPSCHGWMNPQITIDRHLIRRHDHYHKYVSRRAYLSLITTLILLFIAIEMFITENWFWGAIVTIVASGLFFVYYILRKLQSGMAYKAGYLAPGIVINVQPLEIAVIINTAADKGSPKHYGCKRMQIKNLPLHSHEIGERVPCSIMFGELDENYYTSYDLRPLAWGTGCKEEIGKEIERIPEEDWKRLETLLGNGNLFRFEMEEMACFDENGDLMGII